MQFAAIGTDGRRLVVWGLAATVADAREEASEYEGEVVRVVEVTNERAAAIEAGDVGADDLVGLPEVFAPDDDAFARGFAIGSAKVGGAGGRAGLDALLCAAGSRLRTDPADEHADDVDAHEAAAEWDAAGEEA